MIIIKRYDFDCPVNGPVVRWMLYDWHMEDGTYSRGEIRASQEGVEIRGPFFPLETARDVDLVIQTLHQARVEAGRLRRRVRSVKTGR